MSRIENPEMQLLELLRRSDLPSECDRERVRQGVALKLAAGATLAVALVAAERSTWIAKLWAISGWVKGATLAAALIATGGGVAYYVSSASAPPPPADTLTPAGQVRATTSERLAAPRPLAQEQADTRIDSAKASPSDPAPLHHRAAGVAAPKASSRVSSGNLEAELELITQAQRALKSGQPGEALRALDEHQRKFPAGALSFERVGVRTVALCQSGRLDEGRSAARSYLRKVPNSVLSKRIRVACQMTDE